MSPAEPPVESPAKAGAAPVAVPTAEPSDEQASEPPSTAVAETPAPPSAGAAAATPAAPAATAPAEPPGDGGEHGAGHDKDKPQGNKKSDAMGEEMGHDAGKDLAAMARDVRNRFWIALGFSVPLFAFSPMGIDFLKVPVPFGWKLKYVLFALASGAILYPVWPFLVAAFRAIRERAATMAVLVVLSVGTGYLFSVGATLVWGGKTSSRRRSSCSTSSCWAIGLRCAPAPERPTRLSR